MRALHIFVNSNPIARKFAFSSQHCQFLKLSLHWEEGCYTCYYLGEEALPYHPCVFPVPSWQCEDGRRGLGEMKLDIWVWFRPPLLKHAYSEQMLGQTVWHLWLGNSRQKWGWRRRRGRIKQYLSFLSVLHYMLFCIFFVYITVNHLASLLECGRILITAYIFIQAHIPTHEILDWVDLFNEIFCCLLR